MFGAWTGSGLSSRRVTTIIDALNDLDSSTSIPRRTEQVTITRERRAALDFDDKAPAPQFTAASSRGGPETAQVLVEGVASVLIPVEGEGPRSRPGDITWWR
ncbi:MAG: hypothetical protein K0R62_5936 [Nonomuraea muscovyensis]|nr:hypothetical protein [Nonomuraea muscovyensis]